MSLAESDPGLGTQGSKFLERWSKIGAEWSGVIGRKKNKFSIRQKLRGQGK